MTLDQHYQASRELWIACEAVRRLWLVTGDIEGPLRPEGDAMAAIRAIVNQLSDKFDEDFPYERNPYEGLPC